MSDQSGQWCILRMSGMATLQVVASLTDGGYDVWTPTIVEAKRTGGSRKRIDRPAALVPGIAFARADRLYDLARLSRSPQLSFRRWNPETRRMEQRGCPFFSVFRHQGQYPLIADRHLDPLRRAEIRGRPRPRIERAFLPGETVRRPGVAFGGLVGIVSSVQRRCAMVLFEGTVHEMKIDMADLVLVDPET